jgi:hypothetical protein
LKITFKKKKLLIIRIFSFKKKEGDERRSQLNGQWKEKEKVLTFGSRWKEKEKVPFHLFSFSPRQILFKPSFFP